MVCHRPLIIVHPLFLVFKAVQLFRQLQHIIRSAALCRVLCKQTSNPARSVEHLVFPRSSNGIHMGFCHGFPKIGSNIVIHLFTGAPEDFHGSDDLRNMLIGVKIFQGVYLLLQRQK